MRDGGGPAAELLVLFVRGVFGVVDGLFAGDQVHHPMPTVVIFRNHQVIHPVLGNEVKDPMVVEISGGRADQRIVFGATNLDGQHVPTARGLGNGRADQLVATIGREAFIG